MSNQKTWLPRFTAEELAGCTNWKEIKYREPGTVSLQDAADYVNKRLEEFEATCVRVVSMSASSQNWWCENQTSIQTHESLLLPPRPIKRGVSKSEILQAVTRPELFEQRAKNATELLIRIEREGIVE